MSPSLRAAELAFLNAPFQPDGWTTALQQLAFVTGTGIAQLCGGSAESLTFNYFSQDCHDPHGHLVNPQLYGPENWRINCRFGGARTIQDERHYAAYRETNPTTFYDDAVSDLDLPFGCQTPLMLDDHGLVGLALLRSSRNGRCNADTVATFARVAKQAYRGVRVQLALGEEAAELMIRGPAGRTDATILLDRACNLLAMTEAAERLFDEPSGPTLSGHQLRFASSAESYALYGAFARLLASDGLSGPVLHETVVGRCAHAPQGRWRLIAVRIGGSATGLGFEPHIAVTLTPL